MTRSMSAIPSSYGSTVFDLFTSLFELGASLLRVQQQILEVMIAPRLDGVDANDQGGKSDRETSALSADSRESLVHELIAVRAEHISRDRAVGGALENWLQAERELQATGAIARA